MEGILGIFQSIASTEAECLDTYLNALNEHQSFRLKGTSGSDSVIQHITSLLSKPATRHEGLVLLKCFLEQCPVETLEQKGILWITLALKACNSKESENVGEQVYVVLKILATKSVDIPDLSKAFISNFLNKIYDSLNTVVPSAYQSALECIETCLRQYPGPSGKSRGCIEKFILKFTDTLDEDLAFWSGKCLHLLQQVRGGGVQGISHKAAWQAYQMSLLANLHKLMDIAFVNCSELYDDDDSFQKEHLNNDIIELNDEPVKRAIKIYIRFRNSIKYLIAALREPYPVPKAIAPKEILNLIIRGLSVTCPMLQKNQISDNLAIGALLPKMQNNLYELLEATILTLKSHLAMYHTSILGIILDTLKWTSSKKSTGHKKPYTSLRSCAYKALSLWSSTMKHGSRCEIIADNVIEEIMFDIIPFENAFTLKVLCGAKKHMSKKARRQLHKAQNEQSNLVQTHSNPSDSQGKKQILSDEGNQNLCIAALQCLRSIFLSTGCFLKPTVVKSTHLKIIDICLANSNSTFKREHLYNNYLCRIEVYNVLYTFILSPHHLCPPPTQIAIILLQTAQIEDLNVNVRATCSMILNNLEKIIHPQKESLIFPPDIREIKNAFQKFGKEKLLTENPMLVDDDEEVDEASDIEEHQPNLIVNGDILDKENKRASIAPEAPEKSEIVVENPSIKPLTISVDLTLDESYAKDPSIHLDSSNDSVEYIPEKQPQFNDQPIIEENVEISKSPEMNLRVEEDEDEDNDYIQEISENISESSNKVDDSNINEDEPSSPKKPRLELENVPTVGNQDEEKQKDENEVTFEDIAATFVDELN